MEPVRLLVCDIDGTLVRHDKSLPDDNIAAIRGLMARGVAVSLISARPPAGMLPIARAIGLPGPLGAFNGGTIFKGAGEQIEAWQVPQDLAAALLALYAEAGVTRWFFATDRWLTSDPANPHTPREVISSGLQPQAVSDFAPYLSDADKIVAICDEPARLAAIETQARSLAADRATVIRSQDYYLDATAPQANKGNGVARLAELYGVPLVSVAVIGDQANDVAMFKRAGLSIAMGQAKPEVQAAAHHVAASNEDAGVADAIRRFIVPML